ERQPADPRGPARNQPSARSRPTRPNLGRGQGGKGRLALRAGPVRDNWSSGPGWAQTTPAPTLQYKLYARRVPSLTAADTTGTSRRRSAPVSCPAGRLAATSQRYRGGRHRRGNGPPDRDLPVRLRHVCRSTLPDHPAPGQGSRARSKRTLLARNPVVPAGPRLPECAPRLVPAGIPKSASFFRKPSP